jgi:hypothetical protein
MTKYLHIATPNIFTIRLSEKLNENSRNVHQFLFISDLKKNDSMQNKSIFFLKSPLRKNLFFNLIQTYKLSSKSDYIIIHGSSLIYFYFFFPWFIKKLCWVIYGYELYGFLRKSKFSIQKKINQLVFKRVKIHLSHIEGDSILANELLNSKASFHYSPIYYSNVVNTKDFSPTKINQKVRIMIGNSNSPNNNHIGIFEKMKNYTNEIESVICPLSYGNDVKYKKDVMNAGKKAFGDKFFPIEEFMTIEKYKKILSQTDIIIFDHWRQQAMGVTLTLLSLGKIVYVNSKTTSYKSFKKRGFQIFDNKLIFNEGPLVNRNVTVNKKLLTRYYSEKLLLSSLNKIE